MILKTKMQVEDWFFGSDRKTDILAFDWETTGLRIDMEPVGISFWNGNDGCYIDLWENNQQKTIFGILKGIFNHGFFIAHNALFDLKCCQLFLGIRPNNIFCTMIASHLKAQ